MLFCATRADAQPATRPEPPAGPLLAPAPDFSQWVVTFSYPGERDQSTPSSASAPSITETRTRTITTTKTKDIVHEETIGVRGEKRDDWHIGLNQYAKLPSSNTWFLGQPDVKFPASGFRDLDWITTEGYIGTVKLGGRPCLVFAPDAPPSLGLSGATPQAKDLEALPRVAYIDAESRLPVQVQENGTIRFFRFNSPPTDMLTPPPDLEQELKKAKEIQDRFSRPMQQTYGPQ